MVVTLGQQYNVGEKPIVILYTTYIISRHAGTSEKHQKQNRNMVVIIYCYIIGCKDKATIWYLNGFPDGGNLGSTV